MGIEEKIHRIIIEHDCRSRVETTRKILALIKEEGYLHPMDLVEGWVVQKWCTLNPYNGSGHYEMRPATLQDILDGKAAKG